MTEDIIIERLTQYTDADAIQLGQLLTHLTSKYDGAPVSKAWLEKVTSSPFHVQLVARDGDKIVGAATLSLILDPIQDEIAYLESFVVDPNTQGKGIGNRLWQEMDKWCREHHAVLEFTSKPTREAAHHFYLKRGAVIRETSVFRYTPTDN